MCDRPAQERTLDFLQLSALNFRLAPSAFSTHKALASTLPPLTVPPASALSADTKSFDYVHKLPELLQLPVERAA
jgi:hypothetical protein